MLFYVLKLVLRYQVVLRKKREFVAKRIRRKERMEIGIHNKITDIELRTPNENVLQRKLRYI